MKKEQSMLQTKKRKFVITSVILVAIVVLIAVFGVLLAYQAPGSVDMTGQQLFVLSGESLNVIDEISGTVRIGAVYPEGNEDAMVSALLKEYGKASSKIEVEYLDVDKSPAALAGWELGDVKAVANGTVIVNGNGKSKLIAPSDLFTSDTNGNLFYGESEITGAIRYVSSETLPGVYFLQGHGEINPATDFSEAVSMLERGAYEINNLSLLEQGGVPEDASVVIAASPTSDLSVEEYEMLLTYLQSGGNFLLLVDPTLSRSDDGLNHFSEITKRYGIGIGNNFVFEEEPDSYLTTSNMYLIPKYGEHEITAQLINDQKMMVMPLVRGLAEEEGAGVKPSPLLQSSAQSWMRTDVSIASEEMTEQDTAGPITLGYAAETANRDAGGQPSKIVVVGDANFATNGNITMQANGDFLMNSVNWLNGGREAEIIAGKVINSNTMVVRGSDFTKLMIICCVVMPLLMFAGALLVWRGRKNK